MSAADPELKDVTSNEYGTICAVSPISHADRKQSARFRYPGIRVGSTLPSTNGAGGLVGISPLTYAWIVLACEPGPPWSPLLIVCVDRPSQNSTVPTMPPPSPGPPNKLNPLLVVNVDCPVNGPGMTPTGGVNGRRMSLKLLT